jgi:tungstate transport system permease protein
VVVGLAVYLALSRSGPLGALGLLFTPNAMVVAQGVLAFPIVVALTHRVLHPPWQPYGAALKRDGGPQGRAIATLLAAGRAGLVTVFLSAFGRVIAEVGAILIVGGTFRGVTRTITTAITLETSAGDLPLALALGIVLIGICVLISAIAFAMNRALTYQPS